MTELSSPVETLENHAALASRIIRTNRIPHAYFQWLSLPTSHCELPLSPDQAVLSSIEAILQPLRAEANFSTQRETENASKWISSICQFINEQHQTKRLSYLPQLLAASLLPLYRSLATGRLSEGLTQTRRRLAEVLGLIGLVNCWELSEFLDLHVAAQVSPHQAIGLQLEIDLTRLDYLIATALPGYNLAKNSFDHSRTQFLLVYNAEGKLPIAFQTPDWASPQLLWTLSNELISAKSELMLPRSWLDTPVPWSKISEHWHSLSQLLAKSTVKTQPPTVQETTPDDAQIGKLLKRTLAAHAAHPSQKADSQWAGLQTIAAMEAALGEEVQEKLDGSSSSATPSKVSASNRPALGLVEHSTNRIAAAIPKVLIGEISSSKDVAFVNVVRRQVAVCRSEERSVCVSMVMVIADDDQENHALAAPQENGLSKWQQKLVKWLSDQPSIHDPLAFLTREGQLILLTLNTDRNEMTRILRGGLISALTGKRSQDNGDLGQVNIPARFHAGIASTTSPGASFDHEELIASAYRCLTVAQRLGRASIKSIEVY